MIVIVRLEVRMLPICTFWGSLVSSNSTMVDWIEVVGGDLDALDPGVAAEPLFVLHVVDEQLGDLDGRAEEERQLGADPSLGGVPTVVRVVVGERRAREGSQSELQVVRTGFSALISTGIEVVVVDVVTAAASPPPRNTLTTRASTATPKMTPASTISALAPAVVRNMGWGATGIPACPMRAPHDSQCRLAGGFGAPHEEQGRAYPGPGTAACSRLGWPDPRRGALRPSGAVRSPD